jgi:hypothetical protein
MISARPFRRPELETTISADPRPGGCLVQDANLLLIGAAFLADQRSQGGGA